MTDGNSISDNTPLALAHNLGPIIATNRDEEDLLIAFRRMGPNQRDLMLEVARRFGGVEAKKPALKLIC